MRSLRGSGLFAKYIVIISSIIIVSFVFLGGALLLLVSNNWLNEKSELLYENVTRVADSTSDVYNSVYFGESGTNSVLLICNSLAQTSTSINADVYFCNIFGRIVYCQHSIDKNLFAQDGNNCEHNGVIINSSTMQRALSKPHSGTSSSIFPDGELSFVVSAPVIVNNQPVGAIFAVQPITKGLMPYITDILQMFALASLFALLLAFITVYLMTYRLTKPLHDMSAAAKQYARGDFSKRITINKRTLIDSHDEISELATAFNSMASDLATLELSRRNFVANVSHELKTPMTTIGGFIDGILDGTIDQSKRDQYLKIVSDEVKRLSRLVTGMLNMSKIEAGELQINRKNFDASDMIFRTLLGFERVIENKNIEIRGLEDMRPNFINADVDMINQVIYNLIDNAVKFTPEGGYIEVISKADSRRAMFVFRNSGQGVPSEEINKLFERFYKVDKSRSYDVKGAGMGLFICKTIIELHDGQIMASSEENKYTEFAFWLPIKN